MAKLSKWNVLLKGNSFSVVLLSRLIPVLPSAAVNYASGLSLMTFPSFLSASLLGKIPMIAWESWAGHDLWRFSHNPSRLLFTLITGALLFGSLSLYFFYSKRFPKAPPFL
ncbi:MAG: TVP38/TMEM64 family protein [Desulfosporosinus sp.]